MKWLIRVICSQWHKLLDSKSCILRTQSYFPIRIDCIWKENCCKAIMKSDHLVSLALKKHHHRLLLRIILTGLMHLFCCCRCWAFVLRACWTPTRFATSAHPTAMLLFVWKLVATLLVFNTHLLFGTTSEANIPSSAKATFKLLCSVTEISPSLTWWWHSAPRFLPEGAWLPLASALFPAVV